MLFGFAITVTVGFLMTAGKTWTGLATPRGAALGLLILLWLSARVAALVAPYAAFAVLDLTLLPVVGLIFLRLLVRSRNWRNVPLALILLLLSLVNLSFHLSAQGVMDLAPMRSLYAGLGFIVMIECVMAGRVVPFFTTGAIPGIKIAPLPWLDRLALAATAAGLVLWVGEWHSALAAVALAHLGLVPVSLGVHALGVGATGGLIIGMMTRTARGHTGRPLTADAPEVTAYGLIMLAAVLRVLLPLLAPASTPTPWWAQRQLGARPS